MYAQYVSYWALFTFVFFGGDVEFQFTCGVILNRFLAEDEQKPKTVSANTQNSQTLNPKKCICYHHLIDIYTIFIELADIPSQILDKHHIHRIAQ